MWRCSRGSRIWRRRLFVHHHSLAIYHFDPARKERGRHTNTILLDQVLGLGFRGRHSGGGRAGKGAEQTGEDGRDGGRLIGFTLVVKGKDVSYKYKK